MAARATGEPPLCKRCKCGAEIDGLSEYHLRKHMEGKKHRSGIILSKLISTYFSAATAAGPSSVCRGGEVGVSQTAPIESAGIELSSSSSSGGVDGKQLLTILEAIIHLYNLV